MSEDDKNPTVFNVANVPSVSRAALLGSTGSMAIGTTQGWAGKVAFHKEEVPVKALCTSLLMPNTANATNETGPLYPLLEEFVKRLPPYGPKEASTSDTVPKVESQKKETENLTTVDGRKTRLTEQQQQERKQKLRKFLLPAAQKAMNKALLTTEENPKESEENFPQTWKKFHDRMELFEVDLKKAMLDQIKAHNTARVMYFDVTMDDVEALFGKPENKEPGEKDKPNHMQVMLRQIIANARLKQIAG